MSSKAPTPPPEGSRDKKAMVRTAVREQLSLMDEVERLRNEQSRAQRKITAQKETIEHLHNRLAAIQSSKKDKAGQVARLTRDRDNLQARVEELEGEQQELCKTVLVVSSGHICTPEKGYQDWSHASADLHRLRHELDSLVGENIDLKQEVADLRSGKAFVGEQLFGPVAILDGNLYWRADSESVAKLCASSGNIHLTDAQGLIYRYTGPTTAPLPDSDSSSLKNAESGLKKTGSDLKAEPEDTTPLPEWLAKGVRVLVRYVNEPDEAEPAIRGWAFGDTEDSTVWCSLDEGRFIWSGFGVSDELKVIPNPHNDPELAARIGEDRSAT